MGHDGSAYHLRLAVRIEGPLDERGLCWALDEVVKRHEILRTTFHMVEETPVQRISGSDAAKFDLVLYDLRGTDIADAASTDLLAQDASRPFNLAIGPLIRGSLIRLAENEWILAVTMHHIVADGWSIGILRNEISLFYRIFLDSLIPPPSPLLIQYGDYARWLKTVSTDATLAASTAYWKSTLAESPPGLDLPADFARGDHLSSEGALHVFELEDVMADALNRFSRHHRVTLFMTLLAAWAVTLSRISMQTDMTIGTPVANRNYLEIEHLIGFFVNTLPLRFNLVENRTVSSLLQHVRKVLLGAYRHQDISFEQIVELTRPSRHSTQMPLFRTMFAWQSVDPGILDLPGLKTTRLPITVPSPVKCELLLTLRERNGKITGELEYATELFAEETAARIVSCYRTLLSDLVNSPGQKSISDLSILSAEERSAALSLSIRHTGSSVQNKLLHEMFEEQAMRSPESTAILFQETSLTYCELNQKANQLGRYLRSFIQSPGDRVAICLDRSVEMIVGLLAILKAGGAYVPLDPHYPADHLSYMIADCAPIALVTTSDLIGLIPCPDCPVICIDHWEAAPWYHQQRHNLGSKIAVVSSSPAYVIYTSGSTGQPKGVVVSHRNIVQLLLATDELFVFKPSDIWTLCHSISFDYSVWEIWKCLSSGACLVVLPLSHVRTPQLLYRAIKERGVTILNQTPSAFSALAEARAEEGGGDALRHIVLAGEALDREMLKKWGFAPDSTKPRSTNMYGITETTVVSTSCEISLRGSVSQAQSRSIGGPFPNTNIYILDSVGELVPRGALGELYIGGSGVSLGYLQRPSLTAHRFLPDPFCSETGGRMYRSGDLGRWNLEGEIEYFGRNDFQTKIRGFRIELGEIEARLAEHPEVSEALVVARGEQGSEKQLVAYFSVPNSIEHETVTPAILCNHLARLLPEHMVPSAYVKVDRFTLTPNGKRELNTLPEPDGAAFATRPYEEPVGETEFLIAKIWGDLLGCSRVGRHDHFFELGGHSLLALRAINRIRQQRLLPISIPDIFESPTVAELAGLIVKRELAVLDPAQHLNR